MHSIQRFFTPLRRSSSSLFSWRSTGQLQQTLSSEIEKSGITLHSGESSTVRLFPALAGQGRFFICGSDEIKIPASIASVTDTLLSTTLGGRVRMVEHLLSALEATGVDNCRIQLLPGADEVPLLDGSAREWVEAIEGVGLSAAKDYNGNSMEKLAPFLLQSVHVRRSDDSFITAFPSPRRSDDSFITAFPSPTVQITYLIDFPKVPEIGFQQFSFLPTDKSSYVKEIAPSRTFCIHEEVEQMYNAGLIKGGSTENAIVCSASKGWLNPPLRFKDEPCRHKVLDLIGDLSLLAENGNQGFPVAHVVAYKGGHSLHADLAQHIFRLENENLPEP